MILAFALLLGKKQKVQVKIMYFHLQKQMIRRIFAFGLPSFIMNALSSFMVTFVNLFLVAYSDTAIAFFGAYFKVQQLIVMTVNGLIQAVCLSCGLTTAQATAKGCIPLSDTEPLWSLV